MRTINYDNDTRNLLINDLRRKLGYTDHSFPVLTNEERHALQKRSLAGDLVARDTLILSCVPYILFKAFSQQFIEPLDFFQECVLRMPYWLSKWDMDVTPALFSYINRAMNNILKTLQCEYDTVRKPTTAWDTQHDYIEPDQERPADHIFVSRATPPVVYDESLKGKQELLSILENSPLPKKQLNAIKAFLHVGDVAFLDNLTQSNLSTAIKNIKTCDKYAELRKSLHIILHDYDL